MIPHLSASPAPRKHPKSLFQHDNQSLMQWNVIIKYFAHWLNMVLPRRSAVLSFYCPSVTSVDQLEYCIWIWVLAGMCGQAYQPSSHVITIGVTLCIRQQSCEVVGDGSVGGWELKVEKDPHLEVSKLVRRSVIHPKHHSMLLIILDLYKYQNHIFNI